MALSRDSTSGDLWWDPAKNELDPKILEGFDAIVHLSGEYVAERWTPEKKTQIYNSRVHTTQLLARTLSSMARRPSVLLCASAIGYYGNRGSEILAEDSPPGRGYLSKLCLDWESALHVAQHAGVRTAALRFGIILSTTGGAFPRILKPFQMGAGGRLAGGQQYLSWITIDDAVNAIEFLLQRSELSGPVNVVAPNPCTNNDFVTVLASMLHCPHLIPVPAAMAYLRFGTEMSNEVLLASTRAVPERLSAAGFQFQHPNVKEALEHLLRQHA